MSAWTPELAVDNHVLNVFALHLQLVNLLRLLHLLGHFVKRPPHTLCSKTNPSSVFEPLVAKQDFLTLLGSLTTYKAVALWMVSTPCKESGIFILERVTRSCGMEGISVLLRLQLLIQLVVILRRTGCHSEARMGQRKRLKRLGRWRGKAAFIWLNF